jgi:Lrp/AsnC family leucine-responsive transcriptional regulator|tara:strand:+ start:1899 stop:2378 length:480 start_codon:yes stop_codon:yes gene_type:complete
MSVLDAIDRKILKTLQADGRITNQNLADAVGLSPSPCLRRVKALEQQGVISGYTAVLDQEKVGLSLNAFISVKLEKQGEEQITTFEREMTAFPEVQECYLMTGTRDYLLRVVVRDLNAFEKFIKRKMIRIPAIASIESSFALTQVKRSRELPVDQAPSG